MKTNKVIAILILLSAASGFVGAYSGNQALVAIESISLVAMQAIALAWSLKTLLS